MGFMNGITVIDKTYLVNANNNRLAWSNVLIFLNNDFAKFGLNINMLFHDVNYLYIFFFNLPYCI